MLIYQSIVQTTDQYPNVLSAKVSARLREEVKSSFDGLYLTRTLLLCPAHEGFLRSMIGELLQLLL